MSENYFKILELPLNLLIDHNELKKKYTLLVKASSHDPVLKKGKDDHKKLTLLERAYTTLSDRMGRITHLLSVQGLTVANDNKPPAHFAEIDQRLKELLPKFGQEQKKYTPAVKDLHREITREFSQVSLELSELERAWDTERTPNILKRLRRKTAAFNYIKNIEQNLREITKDLA